MAVVAHTVLLYIALPARFCSIVSQQLELLGSLLAALCRMSSTNYFHKCY